MQRQGCYVTPFNGYIFLSQSQHIIKLLSPSSSIGNKESEGMPDLIIKVHIARQESVEVIWKSGGRTLGTIVGMLFQKKSIL